MTTTNDVVRMSTIWTSTVRSRMNGEINVNRTRSIAHGEYGTIVLHGTWTIWSTNSVRQGRRVYEGCTGWEQKFPSRPTFGCSAECMKGAWVHTSRLTQIHEEETTTPSRCVSHLTFCTATKAERKTRKLNVFLLINSIACNELTTACHVY